VGGLKHLALQFAGIAAAAAASSPASAQCRLCDQPAIQRVEDGTNGDVQLQIETELNFDRLILSGAGAGAATIRPDGANEAQGAVIEISPRSMVGTVLVHGEANRSVRVELPHRIELYPPGGGRITLTG